MFALIAILLFLKNYVIEIRRISGHSMKPALLDGQLVVVWKSAYGIRLPFQNRYLCRWLMPRAGDIVLYYIDGRYVVKRCVTIGEQPLCFIRHRQQTTEQYAILKIGTRTVGLTRIQFRNLGGFLPKAEQKVPADFILALGDNAVQSRDCRDYGFVSVDSICGQLLWN